ncbi:TonB-dependent receptor [Rudaea sp. 3F27F6]|uniref:TonB-dependent receptor n=1 Tax=Rudaea sp. 3F27F6 TaxID=2502208 RepID=UPI0010F934C8|nr:TonB-dependent receptor [Rudaea sp. 3F27F6]
MPASLSRCLRLSLSSALLGLLVGNAAAAPGDNAMLERMVEVDIAAQPLTSALFALSKQASIQIVTSPDVVGGQASGGVHGRMKFRDALEQLLHGTRLGFHPAGANTIGIDPAQAGQGAAPSSQPTSPPGETQPTSSSPATPDSSATPADQRMQSLATVEVTGTHIVGAPPASPVITIGQQQALEAGQTNLGDVIRSIPQNFSGGQNPGVHPGGGNSVSNQNISGGSSLNLRGLGQDATLTLLNGRRLSYDGFSQGVDISQIPLSALDRIEIVADGASAIYGSDAVGGVANVILKPDYDGVSTSMRLAQATSGGDFQQQYGVVAGKTWETGGFIATADAENDTDIKKQQRSYTNYLPAPYTLVPSNKAQTALFSGHQALGELAEFKLDALYNHRESNSYSTSSLVGQGLLETEQYTLSPELTFHLPGTWSLSVDGLYGRDRNDVTQRYYALTNGALRSSSSKCYCNTVTGWEVNSEGPLLRLPAGDARVALGTGYRENRFENRSYQPASLQSGQVHSYYGYAEFYLPVVSPDLNVPLVNRLSLSAAVRHERYSNFGSVTTPKLGLIYAPNRDVDVKASWGKSFKTPTLAQEYSRYNATLWDPVDLGGNGYPGTAAVLMASGGNANLKPERATSWTATLGLHPEALPAFQAELSYFHIDYKDRVLQAIPNVTATLTDPAFRQFINFHPTPAQLQDILARAGQNFFNYTNYDYDPNNVFAIVNDLYVNVASQQIHGIDLSGSYRFDWGSDSLTLNGSASRLVSRQKSNDLAPYFDLAGTVFNPPHWRARLGATWERGPLTLSGFYNYFGGVTDTTLTPAVDGDSMQTVDLTGIYHFRDRATLLRDVDLSLSIQNLGNERPPYKTLANRFNLNYDSTNYSAIGRFVSVTVSKKW